MPALVPHSNCSSVMGLRLKRGCCCIRARSITWLNCIRHRATQRCSLLWQAYASKSSVCMQAALRALQSSLQVPKHQLRAVLTTHSCCTHYTLVLYSPHTRAALTTHSCCTHHTLVLYSLHTRAVLTTHSCCTHYTLVLYSPHTRAILATHSCCTHHTLVLYSPHTRAVLTTHSCCTHYTLVLYSQHPHTLHSPHTHTRCTRHTHTHAALVTHAHCAMLQVKPLTETCFNLCSLHSRTGQHHEALSFARAAINIAETSVSPVS